MADATHHFSQTAMVLLRSNLGYFGTPIPPELEDHLAFLLDYAYEDFIPMGIALQPGSLKDDMDQMTHAAWMYRKGVNGEGKTEMLKSIIRNRQVHKALSDEEAGA